MQYMYDIIGGGDEYKLMKYKNNYYNHDVLYSISITFNSFSNQQVKQIKETLYYFKRLSFELYAMNVAGIFIIKLIEIKLAA